jgi:hypothetical protein
VDHIIPVSLGGETVVNNLALACPLCNRYKGSAVRGMDVISGRSVRLYHPNRQIWRRHFGWSPDNMTIIGRTASGRATVHLLRMNSEMIVSMRAIWLRIGAMPPMWTTGIDE